MVDIPVTCFDSILCQNTGVIDKNKIIWRKHKHIYVLKIT